MLRLSADHDQGVLSMRRVAGVILALVVLGVLPVAAEAGTYTGTSSSQVVIPNGAPGTTVGQGSLYPSTITLGSLPGKVTKVTASLNGLTHTAGGDLQVLLVAPGGQRSLLMADVCTVGALSNVTLTLDDGAAALLPTVNCTTGSFKPNDQAPFDEALPAPAPPPPYGIQLSAFNATTQSGAWSLFVDDDSNGDFGALGGWGLSVTTDAPSTCAGKEGTILGTDAAETLTGTSQPDVILGYGDKDKIKGLGGNDTICGGAGKDRLLGGAGRDKLLGEAGKDTLKGGAGKDSLKGGPGRDKQDQ